MAREGISRTLENLTSRIIVFAGDMPIDVRARQFADSLFCGDLAASFRGPLLIRLVFSSVTPRLLAAMTLCRKDI